MPLKIAPMEEVCAQLDALWPNLEYEADRSWLWVVSDLAPLHRKCDCAECARRAQIRKDIGPRGIGFSYAPNGHQCPSGAVSRWGHRCDRPTRFLRRAKGRSEHEANAADDAAALDKEAIEFAMGIA